MATFVLVHGAWQGAWAWSRLVPLLEAAGHTAIAVDLPGNGNDDTPPGDVTTMMYAEHVASLIDGATSPVILVGHSMGGTVAAQTSELRPDKIALAIYLCAFLLPDGESIVDFYDRAWEDWMTGAHARVSYSDDGHLSMIDPSSAVDVFYNTADPADAKAAASQLTPQPEGGRRSKLQLSDGNFGRVPRVYIETLQDRSVFNELQKRMYTETPCGTLLTLDTDHAPQLSAPDDLARMLLDAAALQR
ncbi:MAG: alpha/beta fold hydrolase [Rhodospirillaceae bacterium]|nr:alpha/beta fold hydrolase [Rhodospirillaceae bacterium]MBT5944277.1 alpha/beta fold hydrolase [Rhodospirillaceae bacterium]MBT6405668.1 alpha/beta fold hydrolase [Rhodospirillaceae bacterium]MBT6536069.1 alpha/beta fold hydrolase [Rhodospirillaceae bacterium]MBT7361042.1 alpha/beta fold hydrolase [Rhodospirillaceae bacterium]